MWIRDAKAIADRLVEAMRPHCERIEIAGSIRRGCQVVKDIEIVAVPKFAPDPRPRTLFEVEQINLLHEWATAGGAAAAGVRWIKTGTAEIVPWTPKADGRYWRGLVNESVKLDLFLTTPEQWGVIFLIRTGSREFSMGVMTYAGKRTPFRVEDGCLKDTRGRALETFEEQDAFDALRLDYVEPPARTGFEAITANGQPVFGSGSSFKRMGAKR